MQHFQLQLLQLFQSVSVLQCVKYAAQAQHTSTLSNLLSCLPTKHSDVMMYKDKDPLGLLPC